MTTGLKTVNLTVHTWRSVWRPVVAPCLQTGRHTDRHVWTRFKWFLKMFGDNEQTMSLSSLFHVLWLFRWRNVGVDQFWLDFYSVLMDVLVFSCLVYSKNVLKLTVDNPFIILNTSMGSALIRRSSRDHSPIFFSLTSYGNSLIERIIRMILPTPILWMEYQDTDWVILFWILSIKILSFL